MLISDAWGQNIATASVVLRYLDWLRFESSAILRVECRTNVTDRVTGGIYST